MHDIHLYVIQLSMNHKYILRNLTYLILLMETDFVGFEIEFKTHTFDI